MIKGWKLNPEWVRLMDEKKKALAQRKAVGKITWLNDKDKAQMQGDTYGINRGKYGL